MIRNFKLITSFMALAVLVSCGRTVQPMGNNEITDFMVTSTTAATESVTDYQYETGTQKTEFINDNVSSQIGPPEHIEINPYMPDGYKLSDSCVIDGFKTVMQNPELPTGCEVTALTQTINYYGFDIDKVELCDIFMPIDHDGYYTMNEVYLGDPHATNGFGCNAPVISMTACYYFAWIGSDWYTIDLSGISLEEVFYQVEQGRPVIVWTTIGQRETVAEFQFELGCGEDFWFNPFQHCVTIYGYDNKKGIVYIADPLEGNVEYDMERFERIYDIMEQQAVILVGNEESAGIEYSTEEERTQFLKNIQNSIKNELPGIYINEQKD